MLELSRSGLDVTGGVRQASLRKRLQSGNAIHRVARWHCPFQPLSRYSSVSDFRPLRAIRHALESGRLADKADIKGYRASAAVPIERKVRHPLP